MRAHERLDTGGEYQWRRDGSPHLFNPETVFRLQHSTRNRRYDVFREYTLAGRLAGRGTAHASRHVRAAHRNPGARAARRGRIGRIDRQALLDRCDELRVDLEGGARVARDRDEPPGRQVEHRRGRRGPRPAARPRAPQRDQAGRVRAVRRDEHVPHARHDIQIKLAQGAKPGEGGQLPADEGLPVGRAHAPRDGGRRPDLAAAAPRHLLDRRPQAAHLRPQARQSQGPRAREAREPVGHRCGRSGHRQGARRRHPRVRARRRHGCEPAELAEARRHARGSSASPRPSRRSCSTACATASSCRSTVS